MNVFKIVLAFTVAVLLVCGLAGCGNNEIGGSWGNTDSGLFPESGQSAESTSTSGSKPMLGNSDRTENLKNSEVEVANKMAADGKALFEEFLADAASNGYGIEPSNGEIHTVSFWVEDGVWECDTDIIDHSGTVGWCGGADDITADTSEDKAEYAEDILCIRFAKEFRDLKNAMFSFVILDGECTGAVYSGISELDGEIDFFDPDELGGRFPESFGWSGGEQGLVMCNGKKLAVGTAPVVKMDDTFKPLGNADVEAANKMAADGKKLFEEIITEINVKGDGVNSDLVVVTADNGVWTCMTDGGEYPEELLRDAFANKYNDLKSATFGFVVYKGKCTGAIYLDVPYSEIDDGFEIFDWGRNNGTFPASYKWSGKKAGFVVSKVTKKTYVVGTSPVVEMNDTAIFDPYKDDALSYAYRNAKAMYRSLNNFLDGPEGLGINKLDEPHMLLIRVSFGGYGVDFDDELMIDGESMAKFCMELFDAIKEEYQYSDAWIKAYIVNGKCEGVVFMSGSGGDYEHPSYDDFKKGSYRWDSADDIGSVNGVTMGVYPELSYSEN